MYKQSAQIRKITERKKEKRKEKPRSNKILPFSI